MIAPPPAGVLGELVRMVQTDDLSVTRGRLAELDPTLIEPLVLAARGHGVEAWLSACLPSDTGAWQASADQRRRFLAAQARAGSATQVLAGQLDEAGHQWALLKGSSIAQTSYPRPDLRYSLDIDVLVAPAEFEAVVALLTGHGWQLLDVNWPLMADLVPGEQRLRAPNGTLLDLHWDLFNARSVRESFRFGTGTLLARSERAGSSGLPCLSPADQLVHTGVHAALSGGNRLCWLVDLDRLVRSRRPDWSQVRSVAAAAGAGEPLAIALSRTQAVLGTTLPDGLLRALAGGSGRYALQRLLDARTRLMADPLAPSFSRAVARSRRDGWWRSQSELGRHGLGWLTNRGAHAIDPDVWLDPRSEASALHAVADESAQRRYYKAVVAAGEAGLACSIGSRDKHTGVRP